MFFLPALKLAEKWFKNKGGNYFIFPLYQFLFFKCL